MVLVTALLMLVVVTILGLAMFRSFGLDEKIAGNLREKQRALSAAETAEQYAEYWLTSGGGSANAPLTTCTAPAPASAPTICLNPLTSATQLPWLASGDAAVLRSVSRSERQRHDLPDRCTGFRRQPGHGGRGGDNLHRAGKRDQ